MSYGNLLTIFDHDKNSTIISLPQDTVSIGSRAGHIIQRVESYFTP